MLSRADISVSVFTAVVFTLFIYPYFYLAIGPQIPVSVLKSSELTPTLICNGVVNIEDNKKRVKKIQKANLKRTLIDLGAISGPLLALTIVLMIRARKELRGHHAFAMFLTVVAYLSEVVITFGVSLQYRHTSTFELANSIFLEVQSLTEKPEIDIEPAEVVDLLSSVDALNSIETVAAQQVGLEIPADVVAQVQKLRNEGISENDIANFVTGNVMQQIGVQ